MIVPTRPQVGAIGTGIIKPSIVGWDLSNVTSDNLASCAVPSPLYLTVARPASMQVSYLSRAVRLRPPLQEREGGWRLAVRALRLSLALLRAYLRPPTHASREGKTEQSVRSASVAGANGKPPVSPRARGRQGVSRARAATARRTEAAFAIPTERAFALAICVCRLHGFPR